MNQPHSAKDSQNSFTSRFVEFADLMFQPIRFDRHDPAASVVVELIDTEWVQRARYIRQLSTTYVTFPYGEHSRFGHLLGAAQLAIKALDSMLERSNPQISAEITKYKVAVVAAALLHDVAQMAPGSHLAEKIFFPNRKAFHEELGAKVIREDPAIHSILESAGVGTAELTAKILLEDSAIPRWCWQLISGGGWNVDRGHWIYVDSILCGVKYGSYNPHRLISSLCISADGELAIERQGLDDLEHFTIARKQLYQKVYEHRVGLVADGLYERVVRRAREVGVKNLPFCDDAMREILEAKSPHTLTLKTVNAMREHLFWYHLERWKVAQDKILADLASRILDRRLLKTIALTEKNRAALRIKTEDAVRACGFDPNYYLFETATRDVTHKDFGTFLRVQLESGELRSATEFSHVLRALESNNTVVEERWVALPEEARKKVLVSGR